MKKIVIIISCVLFSVTALFADNFGAPMPSGNPVIIDNFEDGYVWVHAGENWDRWGGKHVTLGCELWRKWRTEGKYSLHLMFGHNQDGAQSLWYCDYPENEILDISSSNTIVVDVYNPEPYPLVVGLCFQDNKWEWINSATWAWFPSGNHTLAFDISNISLDQRKRIRRIMFMLPNDTNGEGSFFIDNIRGYK